MRDDDEQKEEQDDAVGELQDGEDDAVLPAEVVAAVTTRAGRMVKPRVWSD